MKKIIPTLLILTLSACGDFAYKRGAGANDLASDKSACEARSNDHKMIEQCLNDKGWTVQKLDDLDPFATASVNTDNRVVSPDTNTYTKNTTVANDTAAQASSGISPNSEKSSTPTAIADPLDKFIISSWWKIGGNAGSLQDAINECVAILGEAHRPNPITNEATRGLGVCMRDKGWRGLKAQK
ncbi:MAG TPA: hypothetical protein VGJ90_09110 [Methylophilaceae bacterium]|jgi:hypothetical protein